MNSSIKGLSKATFIILKILRILMIIGFVFVFFAMLFLFSLPENFFEVKVNGGFSATVDLSSFASADELEDSLSNYDYSGLKVYYDGKGVLHVNSESNSSLSYTLNTQDVAMVLLSVTVQMACLYVVLLFAGKLAKALQEGDTPFCLRVLDTYRNLGIALVIWVVVPSLFAFVLSTAGSNSEISSNMNLNLSLVIAVLFYLILYYVLKYGIQLHEQLAVATVSAAPVDGSVPDAATPPSDTLSQF